MKFAKQFILVVFVLAMLLPERVALASQVREKLQDTVSSVLEPTTRVLEDTNRVRSVPEPTTLVLLGAAAGVAGARKLWQRRRRSKSV
jgi:hypothetical protein